MGCTHYRPDAKGGCCWGQKGTPRVECRGLEHLCEADRFRDSCEGKVPDPDFQAMARQAVQKQLNEIARREIDNHLAGVRKALEAEAARCICNIVNGVRVVHTRYEPSNTLHVRVDVEFPKELCK